MSGLRRMTREERDKRMQEADERFRQGKFVTIEEFIAKRETGDRPMDRPRIVCLCGSTRFYETFQRANYDETMAGRIVLSVGFFLHRPDTAHGEALGCTPEQKIQLDELHLRKIDLADESLILNVGGYIGESTMRELAYTVATRKALRFLEPAAGEDFMSRNSHELGRLVADVVMKTPGPPLEESPLVTGKTRVPTLGG